MVMRVLSVIALLLFLAPVGVTPAHACNVCHSKNPKMVLMHKELGFKDCFKCHGQELKKDPEEKKTQMATDSRCIPCHKK